MKHRTIAIVAVLVLMVFGATILVYPMLFNPVNNTAPANGPEPMVPANVSEPLVPAHVSEPMVPAPKNLTK